MRKLAIAIAVLIVCGLAGVGYAAGGDTEFSWTQPDGKGRLQYTDIDILGASTGVFATVTCSGTVTTVTLDATTLTATTLTGTTIDGGAYTANSGVYTGKTVVVTNLYIAATFTQIITYVDGLYIGETTDP